MLMTTEKRQALLPAPSSTMVPTRNSILVATFFEEEFKPKATQDMAVSGGTRECALTFRTNDFVHHSTGGHLRCGGIPHHGYHYDEPLKTTSKRMKH